MALLNATLEGNAVLFDEASGVELGKSLAERYAAAAPYPHIAVENFLPAEILDRVIAEFPAHAGHKYLREQEKFKAEYHPDRISSAFARNLFYSFNSAPFIRFLEKLTGIAGLIPDPHFLGGGFHETTTGGKLGIHADFNIHPLGLIRRINVLIYLNRNWDPGYGGALELWDTKMQAKVQSYFPDFNRCVIFNTEDTSFHGQPDPLTCPPNASRRSIALYYYTAPERPLASYREHTTQFRARKGTRDRIDWKILTRETLKDFLPPVVTRSLLRLRDRLRPGIGR